MSQIQTPSPKTSPRDGTRRIRAMHQPSFLAAAKYKSLVAFRFLWLRSFEDPIAIRPDGTATLTGKKADGPGGGCTGAIRWNKSFDIPNPQVRQFMTHLQKAGFWLIATRQSGPGND